MKSYLMIGFWADQETGQNFSASKHVHLQEHETIDDPIFINNLLCSVFSCEFEPDQILIIQNDQVVKRYQADNGDFE